MRLRRLISGFAAKTSESSYLLPKTWFFIFLKFLSSTSTGEFTGLIYFTELDEFGGGLLLFNMNDGLVSPGVSGRHALAVTFGTNTR